MTRKPKPDAMGKLLKHCNSEDVTRAFQRGESFKRIDTKTRRLVRALLKERAEAADHCFDGVVASSDNVKLWSAVRAAVLRPRASGKGRAAR